MVQKKIAEPVPSSSKVTHLDAYRKQAAVMPPAIRQSFPKNLFANVFAAPAEDEREASIDTLVKVQKKLAAARAPKKAASVDPKELINSTEEMARRRGKLQEEFDRLDRLNLPRGCGPRCPCRV